jgi:hypothetical protein
VVPNAVTLAFLPEATGATRPPSVVYQQRLPGGPTSLSVRGLLRVSTVGDGLLTFGDKTRLGHLGVGATGEMSAVGDELRVADTPTGRPHMPRRPGYLLARADTGDAGIRRSRGAEQMESAAVSQNTHDFTNAISSVESVCNQLGMTPSSRTLTLS